MKKQTISLFSNILPAQMAQLTNIVTETLASGVYAPEQKPFTAAQLWNIQRRVKRNVTRRFL